MRKVIAVLVTSALFLLLLWGSLLSVSYYRRWQASKLLEVVRQMRPGVTSEPQALLLLKPFAYLQGEAGRQVSARRERDVYYALTNSPNWLPSKLAFPWTFFTVNFKFLDGMVAQIDLVEMQVDHPGYPHPNSASTSIYSNRFILLPPEFNGYSEYSRNTGGVDEQGNWTGFKCCYARFIKLDERASSAQLSRSLNFNLSCMTSFVRCKDDRQILP